MVRNKLQLQKSCSIGTANQKKITVQDKNMSDELALNFDQRKTFSENYKPMRV